jgi:hypothetical protein
MNIKLLLKNSNSTCWSVFGLPARILAPDTCKIIPKFSSSKSCFHRYSYSSTTSDANSPKQPANNKIPDQYKHLVTTAIND